MLSPNIPQSLHSLLSKTMMSTKFHRELMASHSELGSFFPLMPIDAYRHHKNVILFLRHPRALRSSGAHSETFWKSGWRTAGQPPNCVGWQKIVAQAHFFKTFFMWAWFWHSFKDIKVGVAHPRREIGRWSASLFGTPIKCVDGEVEWAGLWEIKNVRNLQVGHCLRASTRRLRTSSMSSRVREVGQGVTKKGAEFRIWRQKAFRVICSVVSLIQLNKNPQHSIWG